MNVEVAVGAQISTFRNIKNELLKMSEDLKQFIEVEFDKLRTEVSHAFQALRLKLLKSDSKEQ